MKKSRKINKNLICGILLLSFLILSFFRYFQLNANEPNEVEIHSLSLPFSYEMDGIRISVTNYTVKKQPDEKARGMFHHVYLNVELQSSREEPLYVEKILNEFTLHNQTESFGAMQPPTFGDEVSDIQISNGESLAFQAEYKVKQLRNTEENLFIAVYPRWYSDTYFNKLKEGKLYYEILPISY